MVDLVNKFVDVMKALSDNNRIKIVKLLQSRFLCVCEIQHLLNISQPTVSKHLKVLEKAGLVYSEKEGQWVNYYLSTGEKSPYAANLLGNLKFWFSEDSEMKDILARAPFVNREEICKK